MAQQPRYGTHLALIVLCFLLAFPALYALQVATLDLAAAFAAPPRLFPPGSDLPSNVQTLFDNQHFGALYVNTLVVALVVMVAKTVFSMLAGLAFVYYRFPGKGILFFAILLTLLMPTEIILLPLFRLVSTLEWGNNYPYLALTMPFLASAVGMFLFRQHFMNIPRELAEAAQIDGARPLRFMVSVLLPMSWNVIGAHAIIQFISMWNQYLWPLLLIQQPEEQMIQVGVRNAVISGTQTDFGLLMSAGIVASIPPLIVFVLLQKQFMSGFALTRDK
ncbi:MAG: carbohydrate ABC transporter permease [Anaerolineae bacterium]|nr:carbohydrate ABC transporter permease [Anaerolineae bacterium]